MAEMKIRIGVDDIERLVLGAKPSEEARLEFRQAVLCAYAEAHVKPLENSEPVKRLQAALTAELDVALEKRFVEKKGYNSYALKPAVKEAVQAEAQRVFDENFKGVIAEMRNKLSAMETDISTQLAAMTARVEQRLANTAGHIDGEGFVAETFTNALNEHMRKFFRGRTLGEIEEVAEKILADEKKAQKKDGKK